MRRVLSSSVAVLVLLIAPAFAQPKLTPEELIAKHLDALGTAEARAAARARTISGAATVQIVRGGLGGDMGTWSMTTRDADLNLTMHFRTAPYPGENITADRAKISVATVAANTRSRLGYFLFTRSEVLKDGLFGGTLSAAWPLLDVAAHAPELKYQGLKKIDGRELHDLRYKPHPTQGDLTIDLYFEPDTFRHVLSVYVFHVLPGVGQHPDSSPGQLEGEYRLRESFAQFQPVNGLMLPTQWTVDLSWEGTGGWLQRWSMNAQGFGPAAAVSSAH